tara:strand:- start:421 stop:1704 length:1284 start_codon:yes stop_codon:yes gene_type:complete
VDIYSKKIFLPRTTNNYSTLFFSIGIFILPSIPLFAGILFLFLLIYGVKKRKSSFFSDKWNISFFFSGIFLISSCLFITLNKSQNLKDYDISLSWLGIINFIPFFLFFWAIQYYLINKEQIRIYGLALVAGSIPVLITGILQYFFDIYGPFTILNGSIIWYLKDADAHQGMSGLFNNANYTAAWLIVVAPFSLTYLMEFKKNLGEKVFAYSINFLILLCTFFTFSRAGWIGLILALFLNLKKKNYKWIILLLLIFLALILISMGILQDEKLINFSRTIVPEAIWNYKLKEFSLFNIDAFIRIKVWLIALQNIYIKPLWGWGLQSFPILFILKNNFYIGHAHNLPLEIALSYGIPASIFFTLPIIFLIFKSFKKLYLSKNQFIYSYEKAWVSSTVILFLSQMIDIQYFDIRISLIFWVLLAGCRNILR